MTLICKPICLFSAMSFLETITYYFIIWNEIKGTSIAKNTIKCHPQTFKSKVLGLICLNTTPKIRNWT